jgi:hypothetical protein
VRVDGFLHRARMNGLKWAESESAGVFQAVDYAGDQFQPRILCHRITLSHSARTQKYAEIFGSKALKQSLEGDSLTLSKSLCARGVEQRDEALNKL